MDTWNRLTAVKWEGEGRTGRKKVKGVAKNHTYIIPRHRQQCGDGQWGGHVGDGVQVGKGRGKWGHL